MDQGRQNRAARNGPDYIFLSDTVNDPGERTNLYMQNKDLADKLLKMHADWRASIRKDSTSSPAFDAGGEGKPAK
jgi:hypothetical protein